LNFKFVEHRKVSFWP